MTETNTTVAQSLGFSNLSADTLREIEPSDDNEDCWDRFSQLKRMSDFYITKEYLPARSNDPDSCEHCCETTVLFKVGAGSSLYFYNKQLHLITRPSQFLGSRSIIITNQPPEFNKNLRGFVIFEGVCAFKGILRGLNAAEFKFYSGRSYPLQSEFSFWLFSERSQQDRGKPYPIPVELQ